MVTGNQKAFASVNQPGLTKREFFAGLALQGVLANEDLRMKLCQDMAIDKTTHDNYCAVYAIKQAEELLKLL